MAHWFPLNNSALLFSVHFGRLSERKAVLFSVQQRSEIDPIRPSAVILLA